MRSIWYMTVGDDRKRKWFMVDGSIIFEIPLDRGLSWMVPGVDIGSPVGHRERGSESEGDGSYSCLDGSARLSFERKGEQVDGGN